MYNRTLVGVVIIFFSILLLAFLLLQKKDEIKLEEDIKDLFANSTDISEKKFTTEILKGLPEPVQNYFKFALKEGQSYISFVRLTHEGQFKTAPEKKWINIDGVEYFTADNPGFIWKGTTRWFDAEDRFVNGTGGLKVKLMSMFNLVDTKGSSTSEAELQRWVAESFWFPTNLLPGDRIKWEPIDESTAKLIFTYEKQTIPFKVEFNELGHLISIKCERYWNDTVKKQWTGLAGGYEEHNGIKIPTLVEAVWRLDSVDYPYARFKLTSIEYNKPFPF